MSAEAQVFAALKTLTADRVYPDVAPVDVQTPYITYQQVGGKPVNFLGGEQPSKTNARMQVNVWALTRAEASSLIAQVEQAMRASAAMQPTVLDGPVAIYEAATLRFGARQEFSVWTS